MKRFILTIAVTLFCAFSFAQKAPMKFGKVEMEDVAMKVYPNDSSAAAVILADFGTSRIDYINEKFQVVFERHLRIKILSKDGLDWADHTISYYEPENADGERVTDIKGYTFNVEGKKVEQTKLSKESIFDSRENRYWKEMKVSMPKVKEGSVVDLRYKITSPYIFNYRDWQFQYSIPSRWSEYRARFIEYYKFKQITQGYIPTFINESEVGEQSFQMKTETVGDLGTISKETRLINADYSQKRWVMKDVPAFKREPFMNSANNYLAKISFELEGEKWGESVPYKDLMGSWEKINQNYLERDDFYGRFKSGAFLNNEIEALTAGLDTEFEKASVIQDFIKSSVKWNGFYGRTASSGFRKLIDEKRGSCAEINLMLASMLAKAGIKVDPVLISTRSHGIIRTQTPLADQFNYTICKATLDGKTYFLDATDPYLPVGALPERCLNGKGWVVAKTDYGWTDIVPLLKNGTRVSMNAIMDWHGLMTGTSERKFEGYMARRERANFYKDSVEYKKKFGSGLDWDVDDIETRDFSELAKPAVVKNTFEMEVDQSGSIIYLNPALIQLWEENPFKSKKRDYPVDFTSKISRLYYFTIKLPEGAIVEEVPKPSVIALPGNAGRFTYTISVEGSKITVLNKLDIKKVIFNQDEYYALKEFFEQLVQLQQQVVVVKRT